jgi:hypothetical protein
MAITNVSQSNTFDQWRVKTNTIATDLGDTAILETDATTAVGGINELNTNIGPLNNLTTTDKSTVVAAINETKITAVEEANSFSIAIAVALG